MTISYRVFLGMLFSFFSVITHGQEWPYPQDTPKVTPLNIGMASDRPVDISRFLLARGPSAVQMNDNGNLFAYISSVTGRPQVWLMSMAGGHTKQLTFGNGVTFYRWHPDGEHILYGADNNGDEREAFYLISVDGLSEKVILSHSNAYRGFGDFDDTGERFSYASTERNGRDYDIYVLDLGQQDPAQQNTMIYQSEFGFFPTNWQPKGNLTLVTETVGEDGNNVYLLDTRSGKMQSIFKPEISAGYDNFIWAKNGKEFYFTSDQDGEMKQLMGYNLESGQTQTLATHKFDIEGIQLCGDEQFMVWTSNENGFDKLHILDKNTQLQHAVNITEGVLSLSCTGHGTDLLVQVSGPNTPGTVYLLDLNTRQYNLLIAPDLAGIDQTEMKSPTVVEFPARDGLTLQGLLYLPGDTKTGTLPPLVVDIHGGPTGQSRATWAPLTQYLLGQGIAVLDINVRGSTGFGKTYARLDNQEKRLDSVRDLVDALTWLKKDGRVDATRAAAMGGSYGGYMVNAVMGAYPGSFKAGASFVGVADWVKALQTASPGLKASDRIEYGDIREQRWQDFYALNSPINTVDKITVPMFYQHGVNDPRDPVTESDVMVKALRDKGIPVSYLRFPDEGHGISQLENRITFYRQLAAFLLEHL